MNNTNLRHTVSEEKATQGVLVANFPTLLREPVCPCDGEKDDNGVEGEGQDIFGFSDCAAR